VSAWLLSQIKLLGNLPPSHLREGHVAPMKSHHLENLYLATQARHVKQAFLIPFEVASRASLLTKEGK